MRVWKVNIAFDSESDANTKMASRGQHGFLAVVSFYGKRSLRFVSLWRKCVNFLIYGHY